MSDESADYKIYRCGQCGFVYNEREGSEEDGFAPGTKWKDVPEGWTCPDCSAEKADFYTD